MSYKHFSGILLFIDLAIVLDPIYIVFFFSWTTQKTSSKHSIHKYCVSAPFINSLSYIPRLLLCILFYLKYNWNTFIGVHVYYIYIGYIQGEMLEHSSACTVYKMCKVCSFSKHKERMYLCLSYFACLVTMSHQISWNISMV